MHYTGQNDPEVGAFLPSVWTFSKTMSFEL